jgi:hypothetical protein
MVFQFNLKVAGCAPVSVGVEDAPTARNGDVQRQMVSAELKHPKSTCIPPSTNCGTNLGTVSPVMGSEGSLRLQLSPSKYKSSGSSLPTADRLVIKHLNRTGNHFPSACTALENLASLDAFGAL